jgi:hypothetical protein
MSLGIAAAEMAAMLRSVLVKAAAAERGGLPTVRVQAASP